MTVNISENIVENTLQQEKVEPNLPQQIQHENTPLNNEAIDKQEDPNWRAFREARKKDRAEKEAAQRKALEKEAEVAALKAAMEAAFVKGAPTQQHYSEQGNYHQEETEDERIEKKVQAALAAREVAFEKARLEREQREYPQRLTKNYPDFNQVISQENLDYLDYHYPEVSNSLQRLQDGYDKWSDIYQVIKKFVPNSTNSKKEAAKAQVNMNKPRSISSTGITQPGEGVNRSSMQEIEARRVARYAEMQRIMKGL
jgi:hypothetical protein